MSNKNIVIVGGGLAGLMATIKAAEAGVHVDLISLVPVKRSHSVCAQGGINGAVDTKGEGILLLFTLMIQFMVGTSWQTKNRLKICVTQHQASYI